MLPMERKPDATAEAGWQPGAASCPRQISDRGDSRSPRPQVMVKVTGGGRGMKAISAHFRYISKNGRLDIEDEHGDVSRGRNAVRDFVEDWRFGGTRIEDVSDRRESYNVMLSMPHGTDPLSVQRAAREFARVELADHKYVMVLHDHQANPHVHLSVRAESKHGKRLHPRKADLHRWRETFAERLRGWGIDAEATRQATRGVSRNYPDLWRKRAAEEGREHKPRPGMKPFMASRQSAAQDWAEIASALRGSTESADLRLARDIERFVIGRTLDREVPKERTKLTPEAQRDIGRIDGLEKSR